MVILQHLLNPKRRMLSHSPTCLSTSPYTSALHFFSSFHGMSIYRFSSFIKEEVIWRILCQLCLALRECHCRKVKVLHRDIKPANIFMDENLNVKLGDFGLAKMLSEKSKYAHTNVGTPYYMSPVCTFPF